MTKVCVFTDEFLSYDLHYSLGVGEWNSGDGHCWIFDKDNRSVVEERVVESFKAELNKLLDGAEELEEE